MEPQTLGIPESAAQFGNLDWYCAAIGIVVLSGLFVGFVELRARDVLEQRERETGKGFTWKVKLILYLVLFAAAAAVGTPLGIWLWDSVLVGLVCGAIGGGAGSWLVKLGKRFLKRRLEKRLGEPKDNA